MITIEPIKVGLKEDVAIYFTVLILSFLSDATTCSVYWELLNEEKEVLDKGKEQLNEQEFKKYGEDNSYVEDIALARVGVTRKINKE